MLESCGAIKGLSLASPNSLAPRWKRAYTELMGLGRKKRRGEGAAKEDVLRGRDEAVVEKLGTRNPLHLVDDADTMDLARFRPVTAQ
ncbi:hypothetical protein Q5P01_014853 [Channa striata]|uniref:Uncharacterized protein n=1 Tax=Channa striata TaxID=64152 RepID=A0AA88MGU3_CHASR|nr:hypothetical protein Q5P01_014853 [Channa striata]